MRAWDILDSYRGSFFQGEWPSIPHMVKMTVDAFPSRIAFSIYRKEDKETYTYTQMYQRILDIASFLDQQGISKGDTVILNGKNSPQWGLAYLGILFSGATVVPLDNQMPIDRVDSLSEFSESKAIFADSDVLKKLGKKKWFNSISFSVSLDENSPTGSINFSSIEEGGKEIAHTDYPDGEDTAAILFTSGTTGNEKGVILTHANFVSDVYQASDSEFLTITEEDVLYALLPLHHSYAMTAIFLESLKIGCELIFGPQMIVSKILQDLKLGNVTVFLAIPLLYNKLLAGLMKKVREKGIFAYGFIRLLMKVNGLSRSLFKINHGKRWFKQLLDGIGMLENRICICGGGPLSPTTFTEYQQLGLDFVQGYGLTETAPIITLNPVSHFKVKSVGKVFPLVEMRIADADLLGVGEVQVKGPNICKGYMKDPEGTQELFTEDGFLRTGDLGFLDRENYLYLKGRAKNLIVTEGGKNVYPEEIEDQFQLYDQIEQILIRGYVAHKFSKSEEIEAVIYPNPDYYTPRNLDANQIAKDIEKIVTDVNKKLIAYQKVTKTTILQHPMAMTSTKKIQRNKVTRTIDRLLKG
jgi:long-chain acyl-CoA synthetase